MTAHRSAAAVLAVALGLRLWRARRTARSHPVDASGPLTDDGVHLHVEVTGRADARLSVVLVHGIAARSSALLDLLDRIGSATDGRRIW